MGRFFLRLVLATGALLLGSTLIYDLGVGYFGYVAIPTPGNFVITLLLFVGLIFVLRRYVSRA